MARKRMFDLEIINQDSFLDLPMESKALYFLLGMEADDEGFVAPRKVLRLYGGTEDGLKVLIAKNFIIPFSTGVIVITDWKRNNYLDKNKVKETIYQDEKKQLTYNNETEKYESLTKVKQKLNQYRIEENSIEEYSIYNNRHFKNDCECEFEQIWLNYPRKLGKKDALKHYIKARKNGVTKEEILEGLERYNQYIQIEKIEPRYIKHGSSWFNQEGWKDDYSIKRKITTKDLDIDISDFFKEEK